MSEFIDRSSVLRSIMEAASEKALHAIGEHWCSEARETITDMGAVDTGRLRGSMDYDVSQHVVTLGTPVDYAKHVNYGTVSMPARPFMEHSILDSIGDFELLAASAFNQAFTEQQPPFNR